MGSVKCHFY